jgi:recombinational DNA repair protein (RecF pathway)
MTRADRRDHKPDLGIDPNGKRCCICGEPVEPVYDRSLPVKNRNYWRHARQEKKHGEA